MMEKESPLLTAGRQWSLPATGTRPALAGGLGVDETSEEPVASFALHMRLSVHHRPKEMPILKSFLPL